MTHLPVLAGVDLGPEFRSAVDTIAKWLPRPVDPRFVVLLDDLPDSSARLDLVRLAVIAVLEREAKSFQVVPVSACYWNQVGTEWLISREEPARGFTFANGMGQPAARTVTLAEDDDGTVRVTANGRQIAVAAPSEQECRRLLGSGVRGTALRFPVFPSSGPSLVARGDRPDELVLWRCGLPAARFRMAGPVLAAIFASTTSGEALAALVEIDGELVYVHHGRDPGWSDLRAPIGFSVADETERDLSPLYVDSDEPWRWGAYFRRAGTWWNLHHYGGKVTLKPSTGDIHQPGSWPWHAKVYGGHQTLFGPGCSDAWVQGTAWRARRPGVGDAIITAPPGEDVLGLTTVGGSLALLTREGDVIRARTEDDVRTVVEVPGPVLRHHELPWIGVQRSPHLVEVIDIATGAVLHRVSTG